MDMNSLRRWVKVASRNKRPGEQAGAVDRWSQDTLHAQRINLAGREANRIGTLSRAPRTLVFRVQSFLAFPPRQTYRISPLTFPWLYLEITMWENGMCANPMYGINWYDLVAYGIWEVSKPIQRIPRSWKHYKSQWFALNNENTFLECIIYFFRTVQYFTSEGEVWNLYNEDILAQNTDRISLQRSPNGKFSKSFLLTIHWIRRIWFIRPREELIIIINVDILKETGINK